MSHSADNPLAGEPHVAQPTNGGGESVSLASIYSPPPLASKRQAGVTSEPPVSSDDSNHGHVENWYLPQVEDEDHRDGWHGWLLVLPAWLISSLIHMLAIIILGLIPYWFDPAEPEMQLVMSTADVDGEQLDLESFEQQDLQKEFEAVVDLSSPEVMVVVDDPVASLAPEIAVVTEGMTASPLASPSRSTGLQGRDPGMRRVLVGMFGGTEGTERAVLDGLGWLVRMQYRDPDKSSTYGTWSLKTPYSDPGPTENREAATAMAMLAFQGHGVTHKQGPQEFRKAVDLGRHALLRMQSRDGSLMSPKNRDAHNHRIYAHCLGTIALCELYGMSKDEALREPAQRAVDFLVSIQAKQGGWRYEPGFDSDLSVTGWGVMALQSAKMADLEVSDEAFTKVERYLDSVAREGGSAFIYGEETNEQPTVSMTAVGLLCRQYLGAPRDDPALIAGAKRLLNNPIDYEEKDVYEWYYSTQVLHQMGGPMWDEWNATMVKSLPAEQLTRGRDAGSWSPDDDEWGRYGGRLFQTCLSIYMLEVYYRHMPLYKVLE